MALLMVTDHLNHVPGFIPDWLALNSDFMFILVIPFLYLYNGKHEPKTAFSKRFFYVFYPAHLWLLATIAYFVS